MHKTTQKWIAAAVFLAILLIGLGSFQDYGISTDEEACHFRAVVTAKFITDQAGLHVLPDNLPTLENYSDRDHGVLFDLAAYGLERLLRLNDSRDIFIFRHLLNFLAFYLSLTVLFRMVVRRQQDFLSGLLAVAMMVLSPRIFADAFYNAKDLIFMVTYLLAMDTASRFLDTPGWKSALLHGLTTAISMATRVMGVIILPVTIVLLLLKSWQKDKKDLRKAIGLLLVYLLACALLTVLFWPMLWTDPVHSFLSAFQSLSHFDRWNKDVLLAGTYFSATNLPWYYSLTWIGVTTPLIYLAFFLIGAVVWLRRMIRLRFNFWSTSADRTDSLCLALLAGPVLSVIIFHSVLYDGWRQLYFVYPALIMLALNGFNAVRRWLAGHRRFWQVAFSLLILGSFLNTGIFMIRAHPLENVYFNSLAGSNWRARYDLDYWGLANRQALEYILQNDSHPEIYISEISAASVAESFRIVAPADRSRLKYIAYSDLPQQGSGGTASQLDVPVYVFNNYKRLKDPDQLDNNPNYQPYYIRQVSGETILSVYRWLP